MNNLAALFRVSLWWLLPLAALTAAIGWETDWGSALEKRPEPVAPIAPNPVVASLLPEYEIAGGVAARTEMVDRTLFNPTRRAAARLQRGQFALTGTMLVDGKSTAFLREVAGNKPRRVQAGEKINGLLVAVVKPDRVTFTMGDESEEVFLKVATNPRPTSAPAAVAQAAPPPPGGAQTAVVQPGLPGATGAAQTLAERRRAARAQAASAAAAGGGATPSADGAAAPGAPRPGAATGVPVAPGTVDPRAQDVSKNFQRRQR